jgi:hypothetical protein
LSPSVEPPSHVYTLRHAVVHCLDDDQDRVEGGGLQGNEALEEAEGNGNNFDIFHCTAHAVKTGQKRHAFCMLVMCRMLIVDITIKEQ